jgi:DHA1 family bicyclomycin/chloramphenicol resistance-like MFS transporter
MDHPTDRAAPQPAPSAGTTAQPRRRPSLLILIIVSAVGPLGINILLPSMPAMERAFDTSYGNVQLTLSLYFIGFAVSQLLYGPLGDRFGRRPVILIALVLGAIGAATTLIGGSIWVVVAGRFLQALGIGGGFVLARAMVRDLFDRDRAAGAIATITMALVVAPMFAPLIGSYLDAWLGWRGPMALMAILPLIIAVLGLRYLHETLREPQSLPSPIGILAIFAALLRRPPFLGYTLHTGFSSAVYFSFLGGGPYVMQTLLGVSPEGYAVWFISVGLTYMVGNLFSSRYSHVFGVDRLIWIGNSIVLASTLALAGYMLVYPLTPLVFMGAVALIGLANGLNIPNGFAGAISVEPARAGTASGLAGFVQQSIGALVSFIAGAMLTTSAAPLAAVFVICSALAILSHCYGQRGHAN